MKKVPKYIKEKMRLAAVLYNKADQEMKKVEDWLEKHGIEISEKIGGLSDGCGCSLEELECGHDITDIICERIEMDFLNKNGD